MELTPETKEDLLVFSDEQGAAGNVLFEQKHQTIEKDMASFDKKDGLEVQEEAKYDESENTDTNTKQPRTDHTPVYSQTDLEKIMKKVQETSEEEKRILLSEIQILEQKYEAILLINAELNAHQNENKRTEKELEKHRQERIEQQSTIERLLYEKQQLQIETTSINSAFHDLRQRYEEQKRISEKLRVSEKEYSDVVLRYKKELQEQEKRFQALKQHAEERLKEANEELKNKTTDSDLLIFKAKLQKTEARNSHLEQLLESKEKENRELLSICDELMKKIDGKEQSNTR